MRHLLLYFLVSISINAIANESIILDSKSPTINASVLGMSEKVDEFGLVSLFYIHPPGECVPYGCRGEYILTYPKYGEIEGEGNLLAKKFSGDWEVLGFKRLDGEFYLKADCEGRVEYMAEIEYRKFDSKKQNVASRKSYFAVYYIDLNNKFDLDVSILQDLTKISNNCLG